MRLNTSDEWVAGAGRVTQYEYQTDRQNGSQYGNVTEVREWGVDTFNQTLSAWQQAVDAGALERWRTSTSEYFPNTSWPANSNGVYIVDRPARQRV